MSFRFRKMWLLALALAGLDARAASAQQLSLSISPSRMEIERDADPFRGLNLGGGFIEFLLTGRISPIRMSMMFAAEPLVTPESRIPGVEIVPYQGPIAPGSVVLNVTRKKVYRILNDGLMEVYPERMDISSVLKSRLASVD